MGATARCTGLFWGGKSFSYYTSNTALRRTAALMMFYSILMRFEFNEFLTETDAVRVQ
jgi:hypothetical protein